MLDRLILLIFLLCDHHLPASKKTHSPHKPSTMSHISDKLISVLLNHSMNSTSNKAVYWGSKHKEKKLNNWRSSINKKRNNWRREFKNRKWWLLKWNSFQKWQHTRINGKPSKKTLMHYLNVINSPRLNLLPWKENFKE
jgi:hypothetical protein